MSFFFDSLSRPTTSNPGQSMGFGSGSGLSGAHPGYAAAAHSGASNLDMAEFPALGSQVSSHTNSGSSSAGGLFSSYASHVGTGGANSGVLLSRNGTSFAQEEFPALNRSHVSENRGAHPNVHAYGAEHTAVWQQEQQRQTMVRLFHSPQAQELARKQGMNAPQSPSTTHGSAGWMQSQSFGTQHHNILHRIGLAARSAHEPSALRSEAGSDPSAATVDAVRDGSARAAYMAASGDEAALPIHQVLVSPVDRFGLVGLVNLLKTQDPDVAMLTMGNNLQSLGMNLDATESLHPSFVTPWSQDPALASMQVEPAYQLPNCYNVQPPPPAQTKMASFSDETLFFIFYSTPRDVLQEVAAQELYARNWRYHKGLHLWLTKEPNMEPLQKTPTYERGTYVFFDPASWDKVSKNFVLMYEMLEEKPSSQSLLATASVHQGTPTLPAQVAGKALPSQPMSAVTVAAAAASARGSAQPSPSQGSPQTFS